MRLKVCGRAWPPAFCLSWWDSWALAALQAQTSEPKPPGRQLKSGPKSVQQMSLHKRTFRRGGTWGYRGRCEDAGRFQGDIECQSEGSLSQGVSKTASKCWKPEKDLPRATSSECGPARTIHWSPNLQKCPSLFRHKSYVKSGEWLQLERGATGLCLPLPLCPGLITSFP